MTRRRHAAQLQQSRRSLAGHQREPGRGYAGVRRRDGDLRPGEIRSLCSWCVPEIAVVTAIGPVHLERMKRLEVIEAAKYEITERASVVIVNVDDLVLARWPPRLADAGTRVRSAGSINESASVRVRVEGSNWIVSVERRRHRHRPAIQGVQRPIWPARSRPRSSSASRLVNCSIGSAASAPSRIDPTSSPPHRASRSSTTRSTPIRRVPRRPEGAHELDAVRSTRGGHAGMVELGRDQYGENLALARRSRSTDSNS